MRRTLSAATCDQRRFGFLVIDLNDFKPVNDRYGHAGSDALLRAVAACMLGAIRAADFCVRIGGANFPSLSPAFMPKLTCSRLPTNGRRYLRRPLSSMQSWFRRVPASAGLCSRPTGQARPNSWRSPTRECIVSSGLTGVRRTSSPRREHTLWRVSTETWLHAGQQSVGATSFSPAVRPLDWQMPACRRPKTPPDRPYSHRCCGDLP